MRLNLQRFSLTLLLLVCTVEASSGQEPRADGQASAGHAAPLAGVSGNVTSSTGEKTNAPTSAPPGGTNSIADADIADPLVRVLVSKGVISVEEGRVVASGRTPVEQRDRLASMLRDKGIISPVEFETIRATPLLT